MTAYCSNDYRLWCSQEKRVVFGRDITFDETKFAVEEPTFYEEQESEGKIEEIAQESIEQDIQQATKDFEETSETERRRSSRKKITPKYFEDYDTSTVALGASVDDVPLTYYHIQERPDSDP